MSDESLHPAERSRMRKRDRRMSASSRKLMQNGSGKRFKQIGDLMAKRAVEATARLEELRGPQERKGAKR